MEFKLQFNSNLVLKELAIASGRGRRVILGVLFAWPETTYNQAKIHLASHLDWQACGSYFIPCSPMVSNHFTHITDDNWTMT